MSKLTAAATRAKFVKPAQVIEPEIKKDGTEPAFQPAQRADGVLAHNLEWMELEGCIYLRIDMKKEGILSSNGKPMVSTSRGFITLGGTQKMALSLNAMKR